MTIFQDLIQSIYEFRSFIFWIVIGMIFILRKGLK